MDACFSHEGIVDLPPDSIIASVTQMPRFDTEPTPNPNSLKITTKAGAFIDSGMESFADAQSAAGHQLGSRLFLITGVMNVFILPQFLTVTKSPEGNWKEILPQVKQVLTDYFAGVDD